MKLTKGKIARLHKTNRQSVKKQKRNKKHRNVKNLMSLNHKQSSHLANKSMKKYKKVSEELVQYVGGKPLNPSELANFKQQLSELLTEVKRKDKSELDILYNFERKYCEGLVQVLNNKRYNINTLKKICSPDVSINVLVISDDNLYMILAMSDGRVIVCEIDGTFINSYSHDESVTALVFINNVTTGGGGVIISGSTDGIMKRFEMNTFDGKLSQTAEFDFKSNKIFSIVCSQDGNNILVTTTNSTDNSFNMVIYSSETLKPMESTTKWTIKNAIQTTATIYATGITSFVAGVFGNEVGGIPLAIAASTIWASVLGYVMNGFLKYPPEFEKSHRIQFKIKYMTLNKEKSLLAFCTDGRINILKLNPDATPGMMYKDEKEKEQIPDELIIDNKYFDEFNVACFSSNSTHIVCGAGNIFSIWEIDMVNKGFNQQLMVTLYSPITSITLGDSSEVFCGFSDGSIQKNPEMIKTPETINYCWIGGHFDEVRNLYLVNNELFSSSLDGTIRKIDVSSDKDTKILHSTLLINSAPELNVIKERNPFIDPKFVFENDDRFFDGKDKNTLDDLINGYFSNDERTAQFADFRRLVEQQNTKLSAKSNTLDSISKIDNIRISENKQAEDIYNINKSHNDAEKKRLNELASSSSEKANELRRLGSDLNKINLARNNAKELIVQKFQKSINQITTSTSESQKKRFKEILRTYYGLFLTYVSECIKEAVNVLNNYIIDLVTDHYEKNLQRTIQDFGNKLFEIEKEIRERTGESLSDSFWSSVTTLENEDTLVILELYDSSPKFKQLKTVKSLIDKNTSYSSDDKGVYMSIVNVHEALDNLNFKVRKYNLDFIKRGKYEFTTLDSNDILMVLCQTDILSGESLKRIMEFANMFEDKPLVTNPAPPENKLSKMLDFKTFEDFKSSLDQTNYSVLPELEWPTFFNFVKDKFIAVPSTEHITSREKNTLFIRTLEIPNIKEEPADVTSEVETSVPEVQTNDKVPTNDEVVPSNSNSENDEVSTDAEDPAHIIKLKVSGHAKLTTDILKELIGDVQTRRQDSTYSKWLKMLNDKGVTTLNQLDNMKVDDVNELDQERTSNRRGWGKKGLASSILEMKNKRTILRYRMGQLPKKPSAPAEIEPQSPSVTPQPPSVIPQTTTSMDGNSTVAAAFSSALRSPPSNLTDEELGRATKVFINELVQKIGPIINNMPYGSQETTDSVLNAHKAVYTNPNILFKQPAEEVKSSDQGATVTSQGVSNQEEVSLTDEKEASDGEELKTSTNEQETKTSTNEQETKTSTSEQHEEVEVKSNSNLPEVLASGASESDISYLEDKVVKLPWSTKLLLETENKHGGGQKGGAKTIRDVDNYKSIMDCYAKRLQRFASTPDLPGRTVSEINSGIVEDWYHYKTNRRKVYVDKVVTDAVKFPSTNTLYKFDLSRNGGEPVDNILYVKFIVLETSDHAIKSDTTEKNYKYVTVTALKTQWGVNKGWNGNSNITKKEIHVFIQTLIEELRKETTITTIKFLVSTNNNMKEFVQLENSDGTEYNANYYKPYTNPQDDKGFIEISDYLIQELLGIRKLDFMLGSP